MSKVLAIEKKLAELKEAQKKLLLEKRKVEGAEMAKARKLRARKLIECASFLLGDDYEWLHEKIKEKEKIEEVARLLQTKVHDFIKMKKAGS